MNLVTPDLGLFVWTLVGFLILLFILRKYAWNPILTSLKERDNSIAEALQSAEKAREEIATLKADNEAIVREAKLEKDAIIKEARESSAKIVENSKSKAQQEYDKILIDAKKQIESEKNLAVKELKQQLAGYSVEIAEKILKKQLDNKESQKAYISKLVEEIELS